MKSMKALVFRAPGDYHVEEVPFPKVQPNGLLIKVAACALCGSDLRTLRFGHRRVKPPWILGHELSGTVAKLGRDYKGQLKVGDTLAVGPPVYCQKCEFCQDGKYDLCENMREIAQDWPGGFAEYIAIPEEAIPLSLRRVPKGMNLIHAAVSEPVASCVNAQEKAAIGLGDVVVVIGSGPIGCIHTALAKVRGADKVFIADAVEERLEVSKAFHPDQIINVTERDLIIEVMRLTFEKGADVIITANPAPETQVQAMEIAKKGGRILLFGGLPKGNSKPGIDTNLIHYRGLHVIGSTSFSPRHHRFALQLINDKKLPIESFIKKFKLSDFEKGARLALNGKITKAIFIPDKLF